MDPLPTELLTMVLRHLYDENQALNAAEDLPDRWQSGSLARYTVVSRRWQAILEPMIWKNIDILKPDALIRLEAYTSGKQYRIARIKWVKQILWTPDVNFALVERIWEAMVNHPMTLAYVLEYQYRCLYRQTFAGIFRILSRWESICDVSRIDLSILVDLLEPPKLPIPGWSGDTEDATIEDLWRMGLIGPPVHLTKPDASAYPILHNVISLTFEPELSNMRPSAFFQLLSRLPNVRRFSAGESAFIQPFAFRALREERQQLVHCLSLVPPSVEEFEYKTAPEREMSWTPAEDAANYLSVTGLDELSIAFRTLSMRLRVLHLSNVRVNSELFWASPEEDGVIADTLHWPVLEVITIIDMPPYTADGKWILDADPDVETSVGMEELDDGWNYNEMGFDTRRLIRSDELDKLWSAMGKAAQRMPRLIYLEIAFRRETPSEAGREHLMFYRDQETGEARLSIRTEWKHDLGEEVITAWGLEGEKAEEFRTYSKIQFNCWPLRDT